MAMVALVGGLGGVSVTGSTGRQLAELGVTRVTFLSDGETFVVVLEGWAFDAARSAGDAAIVLGVAGVARTLRVVAETAVSR